MSGLTVFFRKQLLQKQQKQQQNEEEVQRQDDDGEGVGEEGKDGGGGKAGGEGEERDGKEAATSLLLNDYTQSRSSLAVGGGLDHNNEQDDDDDAEEEDSAAAADSNNNDEQLYLDWDTIREQKPQEIYNYMLRRIDPNNNNNNNNNQNDKKKKKQNAAAATTTAGRQRQRRRDSHDDDDDEQEVEEDPTTTNTQQFLESQPPEVLFPPNENNDDDLSEEEEEEGEDDNEGIVYLYPGLPPPPHITKASQVVDNLGEMDLHTRTLNIPLLQVTKFFNLRPTIRDKCRRNKHSSSKNSSYYLQSSSIQDDGPIGFLYDKVTQMEITQVFFDDGEPTYLRQRAEQIHGGFPGNTGNKYRKYIFFYDIYGRAVQRVWDAIQKDYKDAKQNGKKKRRQKEQQQAKVDQQQEKENNKDNFGGNNNPTAATSDAADAADADAPEDSSQQKNKTKTTNKEDNNNSNVGINSNSDNSNALQLYLSIQNIPAKCIFPCNPAQQDWYDTSNNNYCLAVGAQSTLRIVPNDDSDDDSDDSDENGNTTTKRSSAEKVTFQAQDIQFNWLVVAENNNTNTIIAEYQIDLLDPNTNGDNEEENENDENDENRVGYTVRLTRVCNDENNNNKSKNGETTTSTSIVRQSFLTYRQTTTNNEEGRNDDDTMNNVATTTTTETDPPPPPLPPAAESEERAPPGDDDADAAEAGKKRHRTNNDTNGRRRDTATATIATTTTETAPPTTTEVDEEPPQEGAGADKAQRKQKRQRTIVQYEKLNDLAFLRDEKKLGKASASPCQQINLCCAVLSYTQPFRTKRGDWMMSIALIDQSLPLCENQGSDVQYVRSVNINIFVSGKEKEALPHVRYAGDVICLHNIDLQRWKGEEQLVGTRKSTYFVCRRTVDEPSETTELEYAPSNGFAVSQLSYEQQVDLVKLWRWAQRRLMIHATMKMAHSFKLSDMRGQDSSHVELYGDSPTRGDLTVMVAAIIPYSSSDSTKGISPKGFLRVWDGTGVAASDKLPIDTPAARNSVRHGDPPSAALVKIAGIVQKLQTIRQNPDLTPPTALSGRVANVAVWETQHWDLIDEGVVKVGSFVRLRNVHDSRIDSLGLRCLHVFNKSSFTPLPDLTFEVIHLLEEHNNRLLRREPVNQRSGILPLNAGGETAPAPPVQQREFRPHQQQEGGSVAQLPSRRSPPRPSAGNRRPLVPTRPISCSRLRKILPAPAGSKFVGKVRIKGILPDYRELSTKGLGMVCRRRVGAAGSSGHHQYRFGLVVEDSDSSTTTTATRIQVVASDTVGTRSIGEMVFGMPASEVLNNEAGALDNCRNLLGANQIWTAKLRVVAFNGRRFFALNELLENAT